MILNSEEIRYLESKNAIKFHSKLLKLNSIENISTSVLVNLDLNGKIPDTEYSIFEWILKDDYTSMVKILKAQNLQSMNV